MPVSITAAVPSASMRNSLPVEAVMATSSPSGPILFIMVPNQKRPMASQAPSLPRLPGVSGSMARQAKARPSRD